MEVGIAADGPIGTDSAPCTEELRSRSTGRWPGVR